MIGQDKIDPEDPPFKIGGIPWKYLPDEKGPLPLNLYGRYCDFPRLNPFLAGQ